MSTAIEWTHIPGYKGETWNPVVGCTKVSQGCKHCYAETLHNMRHKAYLGGRLQNIKQYAQPFSKVQPMPHRLSVPLKAKKPTCYFVNSMSDLFHEDVPFGYIDQVMAVAAWCPEHLFLVLTKRPERMAEYWNTPGRKRAIEQATLDVMDAYGKRIGYVPYANQEEVALPNVWLGTSVEDQKTADERIPHLLRCPAAVRFLSCEPLLGVVDINPFLYRIGGSRWEQPRGDIHWVIGGMESGKGARPGNPNHGRWLREACKQAGVPFFWKQNGEYAQERGPDGFLVDYGLGKRKVKRFKFEERIGDSDVLTTYEYVLKVGRKRAGHLLDGVEHFAWPKNYLTPGPSPRERGVTSVAP